MTYFIESFFSGTILIGLLFGWKKLSPQWEKWFPLARWIIKGLFYAGFLCEAYLLILLFTPPADVKPALPWILFALGFGFGILGMKKYPTLFEKEAQHERGALLSTKVDVTARIKKLKKDIGERIIWDGIPIPFDVEPYHFMVTGSTGSGKSVAIRHLLNVIRKRGDTAVIVDSGGEFMASYAQKGDVMINPFDDRCVPLNLLLELEGSWDADSLARSIIPDGTGESKEWNAYAQTLLAACMQVLCDKGIKDFKDLLWMIQVASIEELKPILNGTAASSQLASDKTFGSIRTIASNYLKSYSLLKDSDSNGFSVRKFIQSEKPNFLYLTYRDDQLDSLKDMISCILDITARTVLSMKPNSNRRIWLIIDEFASIGKVQSVEAFATKARKCGGCLLLGFQSVSQIKDRYGEHQAQSILSCLNSSLILRCSDYDTAESMSLMLGEHDVVERTKSGGEESAGGWSENKTSKRIALATELQQLKNCEGYLKLSGDYPICKVKIPFPQRIPNKIDSFVQRNFDKTPMVKPIGSIAKQLELDKPKSELDKLKPESKKEPMFKTAEQESAEVLAWKAKRDAWRKLPENQMSEVISNDVNDVMRG